MHTKTKACFLLLALAAGATEAAPLTRALNFVTTIPANNFVITPAGGWPTAEIVIDYDAVTGTFKPYVLALAVINSSIDVTAKLVNDAKLSSAKNEIPVEVKIKSLVLSTKPAVIRPKAPGQDVISLEITPLASNTPYQAGTYRGEITIVFDAA
jgi:hypothetical protein